jgi:hypothetical protein
VASGTHRETLHVFYAGQVWADVDAPWHYPWVMFAVVMPVGFLALGMIGLWLRLVRRKTITPPSAIHSTNTQEIGLVVGTMVFLLSVFAWPGVPVYDGIRLFLMVFPLWAIWVGIAGGWLIEQESLARWLSSRRVRIGAVGLLVVAQGVGLVVYFPCQLCHYNLLVGGLPGAARLGFEVTYWGDTVREPLLAEAAQRSPHQPIFFAPDLAEFQTLAIVASSPSLAKAGVRLVSLNRSDAQSSTAEKRYAIVYHRRADPVEVEWILRHGRVVSESSNQGVWLARLVELDAPLDASARSIRIVRLPP